MANIDKISVTLDLWTDNFKKNCYMSVTAHYFHGTKFMERVLAADEQEEVHTAINIQAQLDEILEKYGIAPHI